MKRVAVTGEIASGKSTLLGFFEKMGAAVIDSDEIVAGLYKGEGVKAALGKEFGVSGKEEIAKIAFASKEKRGKLERVLWPLVKKEIVKKFKQLEGAGQKIVIVEVPLLFESGFEQMFDFVVDISAVREKRIGRLRKNGFSVGEAVQRIKARELGQQKVKKADFVIDNSNSVKELFGQAEKIWSVLNE